ncbi:MAG: glycoside hydrolase family 3 C-terminal domain-containing protein, partial [Arachnia sp.]
GILPLRSGSRIAVVGPLANVAKHDWYSGTPPYAVSLVEAASQSHHVDFHDGADHMVLRSTTTGFPVARAADGAIVADQDIPHDECVVAITAWDTETLTIRHEASGLLWRGDDEGLMQVDAARPDGWITSQTFTPAAHADGTWSLMHQATRRWLRVASWGGLITATAPDLESAERFTADLVSHGAAEVARLAAEADVVLVTAGNDPHIGGRETQDRRSLALPYAQHQLWDEAIEANPNCVLVVMSSYPYEIGDIAASARAVVWSSHAGQEVGNGLMDVLDGRHEPTGRLAQTWWAADADIGDIFDYDIIGSEMTWWYNQATPLYPFGHGLTYGEVSYLDVKLPGGIDAPAIVRVRNTGHRPAHELVQVYASSQDPRIGRRLLGSTRQVIAPGATIDVEVPLAASRLEVWVPELDAFDLPECDWSVVAAASAALDGPSCTVATTARNPLGPGTFPLYAWHAPVWDSVEGVPVDTLTGTAYRPRSDSGRIAWPRVEPMPRLMTLRLRAGLGAHGRVIVVCGGHVRIARPDPAAGTHWHEVTIDCPAPGETSLELRLHGDIAIAEIGSAEAG